MSNAIAEPRLDPRENYSLPRFPRRASTDEAPTPRPTERQVLKGDYGDELCELTEFMSRQNVILAIEHAIEFMPAELTISRSVMAEILTAARGSAELMGWAKEAAH